MSSFTNRLFLSLLCWFLPASGFTQELDPSQADWHAHYSKQTNAPQPETMLLNTEPEPELTEGFVDLFNGKDLTGWVAKGGASIFEVKDGLVVGTCVKGSPSTYLCTERTDYQDYIFTCEMKWEVDGNSGVMFRAKTKPGKKEGNQFETVYGPQVEMEGLTKKGRGWSGAVYGQSCGGYFYPLWLKEHAEVRQAFDKDDWNRVTILAKGNNVKTWLNGKPAANWNDDGTYSKGFFGLQIHKGNAGKILFKDLKYKPLKDN